MDNLYGKGALIVAILWLTTGISFAAIADADYTFYPSGNIHTKLLLETDENDTPQDLSDDTPSGTAFVYDDVAIHPGRHSYGHLIKHVRPDQSYRTLEAYYDDVQPRFTSEYSTEGALIVSYEYDPTGHLIKRTNPDQSYTTFESHFDTVHARFSKEYDTKGVLIKTLEYSASPYRLLKETSAAPNANCEVFYTYAWDDATRTVTKYSYTNISGAKQYFYAKYQYSYTDFGKVTPQKKVALICRPNRSAAKGHWPASKGKP